MDLTVGISKRDLIPCFVLIGFCQTSSLLKRNLAAFIQVDSGNGGLIGRTEPSVVRREEIFLPIAEMVILDREGE
jgi:hypothetical protein